MLDQTVTVYEGDHFEGIRRYHPHEFKEHWESGHIIERKMPCPTRRHPTRTKTVYAWVGISDSELDIRLRDLSAEMGPSVTISTVVESSFIHRMIVKEWGRNRLVANPVMA